MAGSTHAGPSARRSDRAPDARSERHVESHVPGQKSMWFFVIGELWIFTCYFACYIYDRGQNPDLFLAGQRLLSRGIGVFNTVVLLTSSLFVAFSVQATRARQLDTARRFLALGAACGALFMFVKAGEWYGKIRDGWPPSLHEFFLYYFMFTALHLVHVALGFLILGLLWRELRNASEPRVSFVEAGATYWHMVDALWIAIFALVYLMR